MTVEDFPIEHVTLHGERVAYRRAGVGPVLLLLHGIAGSSRTWIPAMRLLQLDYTVIAPDFLGHGESAKPHGDYSLGNHASNTRDFLDVLDIERATIVGQSFGGGVALQFAYQFPEICERLVLVDAGGLGREVNLMLRLVTLPGAEHVFPLYRIGDQIVETGDAQSARPLQEKMEEVASGQRIIERPVSGANYIAPAYGTLELLASFVGSEQLLPVSAV